MTKRPARRHQQAASPAVEFVQLEMERIRDLVGRLERESAAHTRRCGEMQAEIESLKAALATTTSPPRPTSLGTKAPSA